MNLHEYQARELLKAAGVPMFDGGVASTPDEAEAIARRLGGMVVTVHEATGEPHTTLSGVLPDQTALQGVLKSLYDLGLPVLSVASA